jgi:hypothetical protein
MRYENQTSAMNACIELFDSIGYSGVGRQGLERCIAAFEAGDETRAIDEYRRIIGDAAIFASALTDLNEDNLSNERAAQYFNRVLAVMVTMSLIMRGDVK